MKYVENILRNELHVLKRKQEKEFYKIDSLKKRTEVIQEKIIDIQHKIESVESTLKTLGFINE